MEKNRRQALLLLVHNNFKYLSELLHLLDSEYFDFFIHVDRATKTSLPKLQLKHSNCHWVGETERVNVRWGDFSIVEAELKLLQLARSKGDYTYYHLLSGADFILKSPRQIFEFFNNNSKIEYIHFFDIPNEKKMFFLNRYRFKYLIKYPKKKTMLNKLWYQVYININQLLQSVYTPKLELDTFKIGSQWFSITQACADYVLSQQDEIESLFKQSLVPDESFLQTIVCKNEQLACNLVEDATQYAAIKREIQFISGKPKVWTVDDFEYLMSSDAFFARKFNEQESDELVAKIVNEIRKECGDGD